MKRYIIEYRRFCRFTKEMTDWTNYYTTGDEMRALEMYAQHVSTHPTEQVRMISFNDEPHVHFEFDPNPKDEDEEEAA